MPAGSATAALARLSVKGRAPKTGYARDRFGETWADVDHNRCDTRNDVLARDLVPNTRAGCKVLTGTLRDPYTGATIAFQRGPRTSEAVQIDHVVALSNAWQTGAAQLTDDEREHLANDPLELLATQGSVNESKGDGDAATWLPPAAEARCGYVARQVARVLPVHDRARGSADRAPVHAGGAGRRAAGGPDRPDWAALRRAHRSALGRGEGSGCGSGGRPG